LQPWSIDCAARRRASLRRWLPKAPLDFQALLGERTPLAAYRQLAMPTLVLRGEHAPRPSRLIAEGLARVVRTARLRVVPNAGHMGPFTHADDVNRAIAKHLESVAAAGERSARKLFDRRPIAA
jgi:pimeloyl-ACP methyl ester carboxylesterase